MTRRQRIRERESATALAAAQYVIAEPHDGITRDGKFIPHPFCCMPPSEPPRSIGHVTAVDRERGTITISTRSAP